jgi:autotransporter-associated beta strand protein
MIQDGMKGPIAAVCVLAFLGVTSRGAPPDTWTSTSSGLWGTDANWSKGVPGSGDTVKFNASTGLQTNLTLLASSSAGSLSFLAGGANDYTFDTLATENANTLTVASGITNSDTAGLTFYNTTTLGGSQTWANGGGTMTFNGKVNLGSGSSGYTLTETGAGSVTLNGVVANGGTAAGNLTMAGTGTLTLSGANTYTGTTTVSSGTLQTNVSGALHSGNTLTVASGATLNLNGTSQTVGAFTSAGLLSLGSSGALTLLGSSTLSGTMSGTGTLTLNTGSTLTLGANFSDSGINIVLNGGTLKINGTSDTFGSLTVSSSSVIDFGSPSASVLDISGVTLAGGATLSVTNWTNGVSYFYSKTTTGTQGTAPENQIVFTGYSGNATHWNTTTDGPDNEHQVTPTPEPKAFGFIMTVLSLAGIVVFRARKTKLAACDAGPLEPGPKKQRTLWSCGPAPSNRVRQPALHEIPPLGCAGAAGARPL